MTNNQRLHIAECYFSLCMPLRISVPQSSIHGLQ